MLTRCHAPELLALGDEPATYVDEFFNQKVFLAMRPGLRGPDHCGALVVFFRRYLVQLIREGTKGGPPSEPRGDDETGDDSEPIESPDAFEDLDLILMRGCGVTVAQIQASAHRFLFRLRAEQEWAWLMLHYGFCPDADERVPLVRLARTYTIPSYHYRAAQLGINHQWDAGQDAFRGTMLGEWLTETLGCEFSEEYSEAIGAALEILCFEALRE